MKLLVKADAHSDLSSSDLGTHSDAEHFSSLVLEIPSHQKELYMSIMSSTYYEVLISVVGAFTAMSISQLVGVEIHPV